MLQLIDRSRCLFWKFNSGGAITSLALVDESLCEVKLLLKQYSSASSVASVKRTFTVYNGSKTATHNVNTLGLYTFLYTGGNSGGGQQWEGVFGALGLTGPLRPERCAGVGIGGIGIGGQLLQILRTSSHHKYKSPKQLTICELHPWRLVSWKDLRELKARWALPVYPVFDDKKSNETKNRSSEKLH